MNNMVGLIGTASNNTTTVMCTMSLGADIHGVPFMLDESAPESYLGKLNKAVHGTLLTAILHYNKLSKFPEEDASKMKMHDL